MTRVERYLTDSDFSVLKDMKGRRLHYMRLDCDPSDIALQVIEFGFGEKKYYLYCDLEVLEYFGYPEDISYFEFTPVKYPFVDHKDLVFDLVGKDISGISEVRDTIKVYMDGELDHVYSFTYGVIVSFGEYQIAFEKFAEFSELIQVRRGYDLISKFSPVERYRDDFIAGTQLELSRDIVEIC